MPLSYRLEEGKALARVVEEAEVVMEYGRNLRQIREKLVEWDEGQNSWGDVVILACRCLLLDDVTAPSDKVYLRWVKVEPVM